MNEQTNTSAVRDAADLIFAAEELLTVGAIDELDRVSAAVDRIARAAKALRPNHLDDALDHVASRAAFLASNHPRTDHVGQDEPDQRGIAAVDQVIANREAQDVEALRDRVRGEA